MKQIVLFSIVLCTVLAMFVPTDANAILVKSKESYVGTLDELWDRNDGDDVGLIAFWLKDPESLADNPELRNEIVNAAASLLPILDESRIKRIVACMDGAINERRSPWQHKNLPFEWCTCDDFVPVYRFLTILLQVNSILERFPLPGTEIVHTSFAEGGLLQTYCLIWTLANLGYDKIHVNVIGNYIIDMVHDELLDLEMAGAKREKTGFFTESISQDEIVRTQQVIRKAFDDIGIKHHATVTVNIYKSAYDYIEAVEGAEKAKRSNSFDSIDAAKLEPKIYTATKTKAKLKKTGFGDFALYNYDDLSQIGNIADYLYIEVYSMIRDHDGEEWKEKAFIRRFGIVQGVSKYEGALKLLTSRETDKITVQNARMLMLDSKALSPPAYFLLVGRDDPSNIFGELVNRTRVKEVFPVVFEAGLNQIYGYDESL